MTDKIDIQLTINGEEISASVPEDLMLMGFLRDWLHLTGAKNGCASGHCGVCTVIMDGKATRACLIKMNRANGKTIETIEGLARNGKLHPIQHMFVTQGAVQCGYCTPGMILAAKALLDVNPHPSEEEIKTYLTKGRNLCRCTGYVNIIRAIQAAGKAMASGEDLGELGLEGERVRSTQLYRDAVKKVTGTMHYGGDRFPENVLHGAIRWSDHPHAEVLKVDVSAAETMPGVVRVITAKDIKGSNATGNLFRDQPAIAGEGMRVRMVGDHVACVLAETPQQAAAAVEKVMVEYNVLPAYFTPEEARQPDAINIHEKGNLCHHALLDRGDVNAAFDECDVVIENNYFTPFIEHGFMEPESGLGFPGEDGGVAIHFHAQTVFDNRKQLSEILAMPEEKIRVVQIPQGGSFGGKEDPIFEVYLALGALLTGRPIKIVLSREESLRVHQKRHAAWMRYKTGCTKDGKVLAVESEVVLDTGAYISLGIDVLENTATFGAGPYYVPNVYLDSKAYFTNNVLCGAMRGFGVNQVAVALESNFDEMSRAIGMDPFEFRYINALDDGLPTASDHVLEPGIAGIKQTIVGARDEFKKHPLPQPSGPNKKIGYGVACAVKNVGYGHGIPESAGAIVELENNGHVTLYVTHHEYGQGGHSGEIQLLINELGVTVEDVTLIGPDTDLTPETGPTTASRQTMLSGSATVMTCRALKEDLFARAAEVLDAPPEQLKLQGDAIIDSQSAKSVKLSEFGKEFRYEKRFEFPKTDAFLEDEPSRYGKPIFSSRLTHWAYAYNTQVAVVEVDTETGETQVLKIISSSDVGRIINPEVIAGQVHGGVVQGLGFALSEEFVIEQGWNTTTNLRKCGLPTADMTPEIIPVTVEVPHPWMPQGVKGFAEGPSMATAPAILNAIYDAAGARVRETPARKDKIKAALPD